MRESEKDKTNEAYNKWYKEDPTAAEQVGWSGKEDQTSRFEQFLEMQKLKQFEQASMLDVGCGYGAFLDFLKERKLKLKEFVGIDINENFISIAERREKGTFILGDFLEHEFDRKFDFSIASGIFNVKCATDERAYNILFETVAKMLEISEKAAGFNFLSKKESGEFELTGQMQIYNKEKILKWCRELPVTQVIDAEGYDEFDTTVILIL